MRNPIIEKLLAKSRRTDIPKFGPGDTIKVHVKIREIGRTSCRERV